MSELSKLQIERLELKQRVSALENKLQQAKNAESAAKKDLAVANEGLEKVSALESDLVNKDRKIASLEAKVVELVAREARADAIIEDAKAVARLVARA